MGEYTGQSYTVGVIKGDTRTRSLGCSLYTVSPKP